jgi:hypothetical protein
VRSNRSGSPLGIPSAVLLYRRSPFGDEVVLGEEGHHGGIQPSMHLSGNVVWASYRGCNHGGLTRGPCEAAAEMQHLVGNTRCLHDTDVVR